ncbi:TPA: phage portal protein [Salmonella enterica subsp. enterica serovar Denver]|nr:phage portal protein [Salmonella enterica subsp. enterica serovar Denver]ECD5429500.1 phage portal protein [Salmonella enterica subsp. enterica serovar Denver]ECE7751941.1 phage portal protein [Salmonella enterica subsp. enterica serovar Ngili]HCM3794389.1 phage portal protein [Salmonella enterica subsp. enterica serovar Denver]
MNKSRKPGRMKGALLRWLGVPLSLTNGEFLQAYSGAETASGVTVSESKATQLSAVWACVNLLSQTVATLPLGFYERTEAGRKAARDHPLYELLHHQPNADMTAVEFWEVMMAGLLLRGNAFAEIDRTGRRITSLIPLIPERVKIQRDSAGGYQYIYNDPRQGGTTRTIREGDMLHIRSRIANGMTGVSPLVMGRETFGLAIAANNASAAVFKNGMRPSGVLKTEKILTPEQRKDFRENYIQEFTGSLNAGKVPLLEAGMGFDKTSMSMEDAQMLDTRRFSVEEICRWFGVYPVMIGHAAQGQTMWGSGVEQLMIMFLTLSLRPWLTRIEQAIRRSLLAPGERNRYFAEFSVEGLLRADSAARAAFYSTMTQNGIMTRNEARHKENLPPQPGGDQLTVQSNLLPVDQLGKGNGTESAKNALREWLGIDEQKETPACTGKTQP